MSVSTPEPRTPARSLGRRVIALVILLVAAFVLFKVVVGFVTAIAGTLVVIAAIVALIWAIRSL